MQSSLQALIKKHEAVEVEIEGYKGNMEELRAESQELLNAGHFAADTIRKRQVSLIVRVHTLSDHVWAKKKWSLNRGGLVKLHGIIIVETFSE